LGAPVVDVAKVVDIVTAKVTELTIEIPEIVVLPTREVTFGYHDFDLQGLESIARQPDSDQIMVQRLRDDARTYLARAVEGAPEDRPENYLVRHLMDLPEVDYDSQNELLFKLSGQMVARVRSYLSYEADVENVLLVHGKDLARFIFEQMKTHYWETPTDYRPHVARNPVAHHKPNPKAASNHPLPIIAVQRNRRSSSGALRAMKKPPMTKQTAKRKRRPNGGTRFLVGLLLLRLFSNFAHWSL
jgi:type III restriction enzyme